MYKTLIQNTILLSVLVFLCSSFWLPITPTDKGVNVEPGKLNVQGKIKNEKRKSLDSVRILVKDSSGRKIIAEYFSNDKGRFKLELPFNSTYQVHFEKADYVNMFARFNTTVPKTKLYKEVYYSPSIVLLSEDLEYNKEAVKVEPFMIVSFHKGLDDFYEDINQAINFLDNVIQPNVGKLKLFGSVKDSTNDTINVRIEAIDSLGRVIAETQTQPNGFYELSLPIMNKTKIELVSDKHHKTFTNIETIVPSDKSESNYTLNYDIEAIPLEEKLTETLKTTPVDEIVYNATENTFITDSIAEQKFQKELAVTQKRIRIYGNLNLENPQENGTTTIQVMDGDNLYSESKTDSTSYSVEVPFHSIVHLKYRTAGHHNAFISLNTNVEESEMHKIDAYQIPMQLYSKDNPDVNPEAFTLPVSKYYYNNSQFETDSLAQAEFLAKLKESRKILDTAVATGFAKIRGKVIDPGINSKVPDARIRILNENKAMVSSLTTDKKGRFLLSLGLNKVYYLEFDKEEYFPTQIKFDTKVPTGKEGKDFEQAGFQAIILHEETEMEGRKISQDLLQKTPVTSYSYNVEEDLFVEDSMTYALFMEEVMKEKVIEKPKDTVPAEPPVVKKDTTPKIIAQVPEKIKFSGMVNTIDNQPISNVNVTAKEGKQTLDETTSDQFGVYQLKVPFDKKVQVNYTLKDHHPTFIDINTAVADKKDISDTIPNIGIVKVYDKGNLYANYKAFGLAQNSITYNPEKQRFESNQSVKSAFMASLNQVPNNQKLALRGKTKNSKGKSVGSKLIKVYSGAQFIDSVRSDEKGNYTLLLPYQKEYRMVVEEKGFYRSYAAVSTKTNNLKERLVDKKVKNLDLIIVNRNETNINTSIFLKPFTRVRYDVSKSEFVEVEGVESEFLANLYIKPKEEEKKPKKKEYQLASKPVKAETIVAEKVNLSEQTPEAYSSTDDRKQQRNQNKAVAVKSEVMQDFHNMMMGFQNNKVASMRDIDLGLQSIVNTGYEVVQKEAPKIDSSVISANQTRLLLNQIVAEALGFRHADVQPVSTDSIFNISFSYRVKHIEEGGGVYRVSRDQVFHKNHIDEYVHVIHWLVIDSYYKNGISISEKDYQTAIARFSPKTLAQKESNANKPSS